MNIVKFLDMEPQCLRKNLLFLTMTDPIGSELLIKELLGSYQYMKDSFFRMIIDTANAMLLYVRGQALELIPICSELSKRAQEEKQWDVFVENQSILGGAYQRIGILEKSLEYYRNVIQTEREKGMHDLTPKAYNRIALIYGTLDDDEKALKYIKRAIESLEKKDSSHLDYSSGFLMYYCDYACILYNLKKIEEAEAVMDSLKDEKVDGKSVEAKFSYYIARMTESFFKKEFEEAKAQFKTNKDLVYEINMEYEAGLLRIFLGLCKELSMPHTFYLDILMDALQHKERYGLTGKISIYGGLKDYYQEIGDEKKLIEFSDLYIENLLKKEKYFEKRRLVALSFVDDLIHEKQTLSDVVVKNNELQQIINDYNRHKKALQEVYQRIELINELGKRVTSSLNLSTVIEMTFNNLATAIHIDAFVIMVAEPEQKRLRSIAYYYDQERKEDFILGMDSSNSILVRCYNTKKTILCEDVHHDERFKSISLLRKLDEIKALITIPLRIGEQPIGVVAVQSKEKGTYNYDHIMLLEGLVPYLSIALNNAIYSEKLEVEIKAHLETQKELRRANNKLEALSSLDGLTRISNRRDFEEKILKLISDAEQTEKTVAVIMVDIDNFKLYNDTYGHLVGDEALKIVAGVIRENLDHVDGLSARFGGEEFVCACSGLSLKEVTVLAEKLCEDVYAKNVEHKAVPNGIMSISVGVAFSEKCNISMKSELMKQADVSLYEAKNSGKNRAIVKEIL